jgi:hypothetical protein
LVDGAEVMVVVLGYEKAEVDDRLVQRIIINPPNP